MKQNLVGLLVVIGLGPALLSCQPKVTPSPDFSVISSPAAPVVVRTTPTPLPPTETPKPQPEAIPTSTSQGPSLFEMATAQTLPEITPLPTEPALSEAEVTPLPPPTDTPPAATPTATEETVPPTPTTPPKPIAPPDEPRQGGSWDMEDGFEVWLNPYGDNCSGSKVASGWQGFTSRGQYGSSCFYLNDFAPSVFSGRFSQQVTFDFVDSHAGLYRVIDTQPGHTYQVTAQLQHVHTLPPMQYHFGVDLTGGVDWQATSVQWSPWAEFRENDWSAHQQTFTADGPETTIFIKGFHDTASQGGATYIDAIEVIDLG